MREWFRPDDLLELEGERIIDQNLTPEETIEVVAEELNDVPPATRILS